MARRQAVATNNGDAIIRHWRTDLPVMHNLHHTKYVALTHHMLHALAGGVPERIRHDLTYNRTINVRGGAEKNIPSDLHMEHLNHAYKCKLHF